MSEGAQKKQEKPRKFQAIRGTRDLLPPDTALWNKVEQTAHEVFTTFGYGEIRPPVIEPTDLFARSIGSETDVVSKEMYKTSNQLESMRQQVVAETVWPFVKRETSQITRALMAVQMLIQEVERSMESKEFETTSESAGAVAQLKALLQPAMEKWGIEIRSGSNSDWEDVLQKIGNAAKQISVDSICLRPEATASVCRAYIEHNMQQLPQPVKLYYMGPMFRRERPQKGRYRQFYQIGAEILGGSDAPAIDAELIEMLMTFFERLGLQGPQLHINSIGDKECRPKYIELLQSELLKVKDKLGPDSQRRIETNPLRVLDSKLESEQEIIEKLPRIAHHLCEPCRENYDEVKRQLALRGIIYSQNFRLVRGLDYYMRTTFEITATGLGSQNAVCGGGRYDGLVELLGGPPTKGIGFAIGEDRLILSLQESGKGAAPQGRDVYIAWMGEKTYTAAIRAAKTLRAAGFSVELPPVEQKFGKALERASKLGARHALILGEDEVASGQWTLKTLADGSQQKLTEQDLVLRLRKHQG